MLPGHGAEEDHLRRAFGAEERLAEAVADLLTATLRWMRVARDAKLCGVAGTRCRWDAVFEAVVAA